MIAGGSGVTVVAQLLNAVCARLEDSEGMAGAGRYGDRAFAQVGSPPPPPPPPMEIRVLLSDHSPEHALLTDEIDALQGAHPLLISKLHRTFTSLPTGSSSPGGTSTRRIDEEMLRRCLPPTADDSVVLCCGPSGFEASVATQLRALGQRHYVLLSSATIYPPRPAPSGDQGHRHHVKDELGSRCAVDPTREASLLSEPPRMAATGGGRTSLAEQITEMLKCCISSGDALTSRSGLI